MKHPTKNNVGKFAIVIFLFMAAVYITGCNDLIILHPEGKIGKEEASLIKIAFLLMLIVVVPVFVLTFWFSVKYKAGNKKAKYMPNWGGSERIEWLIWLVPVAIIIVLSYLTWTKTYQLDPYKQLNNKEKPILVEVISLDWKWLFIYPKYNIAAVNQLVIPEKTPIELKLTSATVMTSFFVPQLGSQMYAMAGMQTRLNLIADSTGDFTGQNQEFSGKGYETMFFETKAVSTADFQKWVENAKQSPVKLNKETYQNLAKPSDSHSAILYSNVMPNLFNMVVMEFKKMDATMDSTSKIHKKQKTATGF